ncbi:hypothetical protein TPA0909_60620 [Streptomyces albus]|nr:hypothetical protein TPA0909_60620 [Streptomyces albus]
MAATPDAFKAPPPETAYADAPELLYEAAQLTRYSTRLTTGEDGPDKEREYRLRRAAHADRFALLADDLSPNSPTAEHAEHEAARTARDLAAWDRDHPEDVAGPYGPTSPELGRTVRAYVRQEYAAWKAGTEK